MEKIFYALSVDEAFRELKTDHRGLSEQEVQKRLLRYGANRLPEGKRRKALLLFLHQFQSSLIYILLFAAFFSFLLKDITDGVVILLAIIVNVVIGFFQEYKAEKSLSILQRVLTLQALVLRDGEEILINAEQLVPGDIIFLHAGKKVPADARVIESEDFEIDEAFLSGESRSVLKHHKKLEENLVLVDQKNMVFSGSLVVRGKGRALVVKTGSSTEIGKISRLVLETEETKTPLQKKLGQFGRQLGILILAISSLLFLFGFVRGVPLVEIFTTSVAVAVSAIPEGLAVAVTVILALGTQRILKRQAVVRKLVSAETLGSVDVICTDKTGTLTEGKMQVVKFMSYDFDFDVSDHRLEPRKLFLKESEELFFAIKLGMLCNDAQYVEEQNIILGNLTDRALLHIGRELGLRKEVLEEETPRLQTLPFDSEGKFMATLHRFSSEENILYVKGASEKILDLCTRVKSGEKHHEMTDTIRRKFSDKFREMSSRGLRILALAYQKIPKEKENIETFLGEDANMIFLGFFGIQDPLRDKVKETLAECQSAGIRTVMITGDHHLTAAAIGKELGLPANPENILEAKYLQGMTETEFHNVIENISIYARVAPHDKLRIVKAWQSKGAVVAMTGDGINDSPALRAADIGVALGSGTDFAKEVASLVLLNNDFKTIVAAVEEGRVIFDNIRKVVMYLLADSFGMVILIIPAIFFGLPLPLLAAQILWINLVTDGFPALAMTQEPREEEIMKERPRKRNESILNIEMKILIVLVSITLGVGHLFIFWVFLTSTGSVPLAQTMVFTSFAVTSLLYIFSTRSLRHSIFQKNIFSNRYLLGAVGIGLLFQLFVVYLPPLQKVFRTVPLGFLEWGLILVFSFLLMTVIEIGKYVFRKKIFVV